MPLSVPLQEAMSVCSDREDVVSMAMSVLSSLLSKYDVDPALIGRCGPPMSDCDMLISDRGCACHPCLTVRCWAMGAHAIHV